MKLKRLSSLATASVLSASALFNLAFVPVAHAATATWTGNECLNTNDKNMTTATNWAGNVAPQDGDTLVFPDNPTCRTPNNDFTAGTQFAGVTFTHPSAGTFSDYSITGNSLRLAAGATITTDASTQYTEIFQVPIILNGDVSLVTNGASLYFENPVTGTGNITVSGSGYKFFGAAGTFTGNVTVNGGSLSLGNITALGGASNSVTVNNNADLSIGGCGTTLTFANALNLTGASSSPTGQYPKPKLYVGGGCGGAGGGADEFYGVYTSDQSVTLSGNVTLGSDITFGGTAKQTTMTGVLSGAHAITLLAQSGALVVNASQNTSSTPNDTYKPAVVTQTLSDDQSAHSVQILGSAIITLDGKRGDVMVSNGGVLKGTGTAVTSLSVFAGGTVAPGHSPGCLNSGNFLLAGTYEFEVGGTTACTGYDQIKVTGTVDVTNGAITALVYNGFVPAVGQSYTIIDNDGTDAVTGTLTGIAEGGTYTNQGVTYSVTYKGGDGNDVVLTVTAVDASQLPKAPNTGFKLLTSSPVLTLLATTAAAGAILLTHKRMQKPAGKRR